MSTRSYMTVACAMIALSAGCKSDVSPPSANQQVPQVEVVEVIQKDVPIYAEWVGSAEGMVNAVIKAQVNGYLMSRNYTEGAFVRKGQLLFEIDPRKFQASLDQAKGEWEKARAQLAKTDLDVKRDTPLAKSGAISQKELDDSIQANRAARASVASAKAAVEQAELNLGFTKITAPIDGIVGIAKAQIGDLVGPGDELASMSTVDPIRVYISASEQEYLRAAEKIRQTYKERQESRDGQESANGLPTLDLILTDGTVYAHKGRFFLADRQIDQRTGTIRIAALFPNPDNLIRPGQFGRVRAATRIERGALLVPQRAVTELQGGYQVAVVNADNKIEIRPVKVGQTEANLWVIQQGLKPGEHVVVEGLQKLKADMTVSPKVFTAEAQTEKT